MHYFKYSFVTTPKDYEKHGISVNIFGNISPVIIEAVLTGTPADTKGPTEKSYLAGDVWTNVLHIDAKDLALFKDPKMVGTSLAITVGAASLISAILFRSTYSSYRKHYALMHGADAG